MGVWGDSHLVLVHLNRLDFLGCAEIYGERYSDYAQGNPTHPLLSVPSAGLLTPQPHSPILAPRQHLGAPLSQGQAMNIICVSTECSLQEQNRTFGRVRGDAMVTPKPALGTLTVKVPVSRSMVCS